MDYQFSSKKEGITNGYDIATTLGHRKVKGEVGLEIECEGNKFKKDDIPLPWKYVKDGSLRGYDNAEYVLKSPIPFDGVKPALDTLWEMFKAYDSKLDDSNRTSVHVHLNAQSFHMNRVASFCALYYSVEELLTAWCGEHRVGNLFCLRAKDAPGTITKIKEFINRNGDYHFSEGIHYAGLNLSALNKFGSLEVRTMRGVSDPSVILEWVNILRRIYELSADYKDPRDVCARFSGYGPLSYLEHVLGEHIYSVKSTLDMTNDQLSASMYEGIRLAQDICYCRDWDLYKPVVVPDDPFGRRPRKASQSLQSLMQTQPVPQPQSGQPVYSLDIESSPATAYLAAGSGSGSFMTFYTQAMQSQPSIPLPVTEHWIPDPDPDDYEDDFSTEF
jgi:hypothetical protein